MVVVMMIVMLGCDCKDDHLAVHVVWDEVDLSHDVFQVKHQHG